MTEKVQAEKDFTQNDEPEGDEEDDDAGKNFKEDDENDESHEIDENNENNENVDKSPNQIDIESTAPDSPTKHLKEKAATLLLPLGSPLGSPDECLPSPDLRVEAEYDEEFETEHDEYGDEFEKDED